MKHNLHIHISYTKIFGEMEEEEEKFCYMVVDGK